jgi:hypothetical protein
VLLWSIYIMRGGVVRKWFIWRLHPDYEWHSLAGNRKFHMQVNGKQYVSTRRLNVHKIQLCSLR